MGEEFWAGNDISRNWRCSENNVVLFLICSENLGGVHDRKWIAAVGHRVTDVTVVDTLKRQEKAMIDILRDPSGKYLA